MIEKQPRGLGTEATLSKMNEIIAKFNALEDLVKELESKPKKKGWFK